MSLVRNGVFFPSNTWGVVGERTPVGEGTKVVQVTTDRATAPFGMERAYRSTLQLELPASSKNPTNGQGRYFGSFGWTISPHLPLTLAPLPSLGLLFTLK